MYRNRFVIHINFKEFLADICLILGITYCSGYALSTAGDGRIKLFMAFFALFGALLKKRDEVSYSVNRITVDKVLYFFLISGLIISYLANLDSSWYYALVDNLTTGLIISAAYVLMTKLSPESFVRYLTKFMTFVAAVAIVIHYLGDMREVLSFGTFENINGISYLNGVIWFAITTSEAVMGVFWEGGLFGSFILFTLALNIILNRNHQIFDSVILLWALFLTRSTAAILLLVLVAVLAITRNKKGLRITILTSIIVVSTVAIYINLSSILDYLVKINPDLFSKLVDEDALTKVTRMSSPVANFALFLDSPLWGNGLRNANALYSSKINILGLAADAQTSTSTFMLNAFGVCGFLYTLIPLYSIYKKTKANMISKTVFCVLLLTIVNKEPHYNLLLTYCILFMFSRYRMEVENEIVKKSNVE